MKAHRGRPARKANAENRASLEEMDSKARKEHKVRQARQVRTAKQEYPVGPVPMVKMGRKERGVNRVLLARMENLALEGNLDPRVIQVHPALQAHLENLLPP